LNRKTRRLAWKFGHLLLATLKSRRCAVSCKKVAKFGRGGGQSLGTSTCGPRGRSDRSMSIREVPNGRFVRRALISLSLGWPDGTRMTFCFVNPKRKQTRLRSAYIAIAGLVALIATGDHAGARSQGSKGSVDSVQTRTAGEPIMAIVSLHNQRITVYDAQGWILRTQVSSGQKGRETPAGIFSVIQKEAEHYSNLYDDAYMPHMQRITWSASRSTVDPCQDILRPTAASGCPSTSRPVCSMKRSWACV
jgi:hypothetical protein